MKDYCVEVETDLGRFERKEYFEKADNMIEAASQTLEKLKEWMKGRKVEELHIEISMVPF